MLKTNHYIFLIFGFVLGINTGIAQVDSSAWGTRYPAVDERDIIETKWRYTYAIHLESNTIIHQAENYYDYYLHFRYDYTYDEYLNGRLIRGTWSLSGSELFYSFKHIKNFEIATVNKSKLVLEFRQPNSKGTYQYHFIRVESKEAPFKKAANELPDVIVETESNRNKGKNWLVFNKKKKKKRKKKRRERKSVVDEPIYISIELIGGGYYGGLDPVLKDYIHIKSDGRLIKEFKSLNSGQEITKKDIPREELEQFAEYIIAQKFFEYDRMYDCQTSNCQSRKKTKPTPIPLRLAVAYGDKKKVVTISIWGLDERRTKFVDYPPAIDNIIDAIQRMAHRIEG
ncbi:MAG: hypothetical protein ACI8P3_000403 [Saprospiraceae bacterium]|jgi:hypothetical protein